MCPCRWLVYPHKNVHSQKKKVTKKKSIIIVVFIILSEYKSKGRTASYINNVSSGLNALIDNRLEVIGINFSADIEAG